MHNFFMVCATLGCTVLLLQMGLAIFGMTGGGAEIGDPGDLSSIGDGHHGGLGHHHAGAADHGAGDADGSDSVDNHSHQNHGWQLARYLTFQTVVAFLAFFGLGGLASLEAQRSAASSLVIATLLGLVSFLIVGYVMRNLTRLHQDGSTRIRDSIGKSGRVYLRIPAQCAGDGKVTVSLGGGTVELKARTTGAELPTGAKIRVERVLDARTVEVAREIVS